MELRDYQLKGAQDGCKILQKYKLVYFCWSVRTGKTLTSLKTAENYGAKNILFLTKKKAIKSIEEDYKNFGFNFNLTVINYESLHKVTDTFDLIILDENHGQAAFPKPSKRTREIKLRYSRLPMIMLSGTPA
ncbi:MAG: superfamily II DNA or RNA helicase, partial [Thermoproteota archaeon]